MTKRTARRTAMNIPAELEPKILPECLADIKAGRGTGKKEDYEPMILTYEIRGYGKRTMVPSGKFPREHHALSDIERNLFLILDFSPLVEDIREQFPLDINETIKIADELKIDHPAKKGLLAIMTADALITMTDGTDRVRTVKPREALANERVLEKLEIERVYFERNGIRDWGIVTPGEIDSTYLKNVEQLTNSRKLKGYKIPEEEIGRIRSFLEGRLDQFGCLCDATTACDNALCLPEAGQSLAAAKHFIATHVWGFDFSTLFDPRLPGQHREIKFDRWLQNVSAA